MTLLVAERPGISGAVYRVRCMLLILIEAPSSAYPCGMLALGNKPLAKEEATSGDATRNRTNFIVASTDTHAPWSLCILNQQGEIVVHRNMPAGPEPFLKTIAPYRADLVVCVEGLLTWDLAG
jgi:hypothetical protein